MSSSGLYGSGDIGQASSSSNTTSLYGSDATPAPDSAGNVVIKGTLTVNGCAIKTNCTEFDLLNTTATTLNVGGAATTVNLGAPNSVLNFAGDTMTIGDATVNYDTGSLHLIVDRGVEAPALYAGNINIAPGTNDNYITTSTGNLNLYPANKTIGLDQGAVIAYSENNDRLNRPTIISTTGNTSGLRVQAPNTTTSAVATSSVFSSSDDNNGKYVNIQARGGSTDPLRITTGAYVSGVNGASGSKLAFRDGTAAAHAYVNPAGPTDTLDLTTVEWVEDYVTSGAFVFQKINIDDVAFIDTANTVVGAGSSVVLDTWDMTDYGSVKYQLQASSSGNGTQASEVLVINNSINAFATEYAVIVSGGSEIYSNLQVDTVGTTVRLLADIAFASTYFRAVRTAIVR